MNKIKIKTNSEFNIRIEKVQEFQDSFLKDVYSKALENTEDIIKNTKEYHEAIESKEEFQFKSKAEHNNIIAFSGERGSGKTSAMVSFAMALKNNKNINIEKFNILNNYNFLVLDRIDPSLFAKNESIFQVILANIFENFKNHIKNKDEGDSFDLCNQREILLKFESVYKDFNTIRLSDKNGNLDCLDDNLEELSNLAASSSMRKNFTNLIQSILKYRYGNDNIKNSFLVLSIDDLDMNISNASVMAEQIRKYLLIPNVIILMAIKVEQLTDSIEQMFINEYKTLISNNVFNLEDNPKNMAERYIEKLIPNGRKIYLPNFKTSDNINEFKLIIEEEGNLNSKEDNENYNLQDAVLGLIYRKTGLIFLKPNYGIHYLIPDNLRELHNMVCIFNKLKDINIYEINSECDRKILKINVEAFENYFYNMWIKRNLRKCYVNIIEGLRNKSCENKNKFIINKIAEVKIKAAEESISNEELTLNDFKPIVDVKNNPMNVSLGDVLDCLKINKEYDSEDIKKLKFAIKTSYSLSIFKILFIDNYNSDESDENEQNINTKECVYRLTAGNVLGYEVYKNCLGKDNSQITINDYKYIPIFIRIENKEYKIPLVCIISFLCKDTTNNNTINSDRIKKLIEDIESIRNNSEVKYYETELPNQEDIKYLEENIGEFEKQCICNIEFIHYFLYQGSDLSSKEITIKEEGSNKKSILTRDYMKLDKVYYDVDVKLGRGFIDTKYVTFSFMAFITKLLEPNKVLENLIDSYLYNAYDEEITDIKNKKESIIKKSNCSAINQWNKKYKAIIPMYSLDILEYISENLKATTNIKLIKVKKEYPEIIEKLIKGLEQCLEDIGKSNKYVKLLGNSEKINETIESNVIIKEINEECKLEGTLKTIIDYFKHMEATKYEESMKKEEFDNRLKDARKISRNVKGAIKRIENGVECQEDTIEGYLNDANKNIFESDYTYKEKIKNLKNMLENEEDKITILNGLLKTLENYIKHLKFSN